MLPTGWGGRLPLAAAPWPAEAEGEGGWPLSDAGPWVAEAEGEGGLEQDRAGQKQSGNSHARIIRAPMSTFTRRECLTVLASAAVFPRVQTPTGAARSGLAGRQADARRLHDPEYAVYGRRGSRFRRSGARSAICRALRRSGNGLAAGIQQRREPDERRADCVGWRRSRRRVRA